MAATLNGAHWVGTRILLWAKDARLHAVLSAILSTRTVEASAAHCRRCAGYHWAVLCGRDMRAEGRWTTGEASARNGYALSVGAAMLLPDRA
jgi:hypothetical protein